jgi:hypothetical protein
MNRKTKGHHATRCRITHRPRARRRREPDHWRGEHSPYAEPRTLRALYSAVDLMSKEVEREKRRLRLPANFGKPWSEGEDRTLTGEFDAGMPMQEMARRHARTQSSIRLRLEKLGKIQPSQEAG